MGSLPLRHARTITGLRSAVAKLRRIAAATMGSVGKASRKKIAAQDIATMAAERAPIEARRAFMSTQGVRKRAECEGEFMNCGSESHPLPLRGEKSKKNRRAELAWVSLLMPLRERPALERGAEAKMISFSILLLVVSTLWVIAGYVALLRVTRRTPVYEAESSPVTVLKPLCGVDDDLRANLATFFEQDHPKFELVFGVSGTEDPAIGIVRELRRAYPQVDCSLVIHDGGRGVNPKVSNLRAMVAAAQYELLLISDSNVSAPPHYVRTMAAEIQQDGVGLVTSLVVGTGEETVGAAIENLHLTSGIASGVALPNELGVPVVLGKSMLFRASEFERLGGFASVANVLAEDYVIGRMFAESGRRVIVSSVPISSVSRASGIKAFFKRHQRWGMMRMRLKPGAFALEWLTMPLVVGGLAVLLGASPPAVLLWALSLTVLRDITSWIHFRGSEGLLTALPWTFLREGLVFAAWVSVPFRRHGTWRGNRVRVSAGTRLYAESVPAAPEQMVLER